MNLSNRELQKFYFGAYRFDETPDGYLQAFQFTKEQTEYFRKADEYWYSRCMASSAKTIEAVTASSEISFDYKIIWQGSFDSFDLYTDGEKQEIRRIENLPPEGTIRFTIPGEKRKRKITVYLPIDAVVVIKNFKTDEDLYVPEKNEKVLWSGDSITQGYGPLIASGSFVSVANRILNYDIINQGIGGYIYDSGSLMRMDGYMPKKMIVSLGTNQYADGNLRPVEKYYEKLYDIYGSEIPVFVITPVWRMDFVNENQKEIFIRFCSGIKKICEKYNHITVIDGFDLLSAKHENFIDDLHPNATGAEIYGKNLAKTLLKYS